MAVFAASMCTHCSIVPGLTLPGMDAREEFHFYLGLVTGLCQYQNRDEKLILLMLEQLDVRTRLIEAGSDRATTEEERDNTQATDAQTLGSRMS